MSREIIGAQGEITIFRIEKMPEGVVASTVGRTAAGAIISHSESGHHHVLTGGAVVMERANPPAGMSVLYAILDKPEALVQDAAVPHGSHHLPAGIYEFRIAREFDPFAEQARRVAD
jgi:hypothetical protein